MDSQTLLRTGTTRVMSVWLLDCLPSIFFTITSPCVKHCGRTQAFLVQVGLVFPVPLPSYLSQNKQNLTVGCLITGRSLWCFLNMFCYMFLPPESLIVWTSEPFLHILSLFFASSRPSEASRSHLLHRCLGGEWWRRLGASNVVSGLIPTI